ncbi:MAG TPA: gliding motility lipoprotein GldH [Bacteroidales bacterium]|nr:gliding motility lipoprotein GldH [Bacteroidales bacterium]
MKTKLSLLVLVVLTVLSCVNREQYVQNFSIADSKWKISNKCRFEYINNDTVSPSNVYFNLRHSGNYKYSNIYLFVTTMAPNGNKIIDTLEYNLADAKGRWIGKGLSDIKNIKLGYKKAVRFSQNGKYMFYVTHGMRENELEGIIDVGIIIEKSKQ